MKITDDMLTEWRKQFEAEFPMPPDCIWTGKGYSQTRYDAWRAQEYAHMWSGFVAARRTTPDRECEWKCDDVDNGTWESCCGEIWTFTADGPVENGMLFCHRCGGKLETARTSDQGEKS